MSTFKQFNHNSKEIYTVVVKQGYWHTYLPPTRGIRFFNSLDEYQGFFGCSNEDLEIIKLKYGSPTPLQFVVGKLQAGNDGS